MIYGVNAYAVGGARNTIVEFNYDLGTHLSGSRLQSLSINNHLGQKEIPLHVEVMGAPVILNNGSSLNELLFRIENVGDENLPLSTSLQDGKSKFEIGVLVQPEDELVEWAMVDVADVDALELNWPVLAVIELSATTSTASNTTITLTEPLAAKLNDEIQININTPTNILITASLASEAEAGENQAVVALRCQVEHVVAFVVGGGAGTELLYQYISKGDRFVELIGHPPGHGLRGEAGGEQ